VAVLVSGITAGPAGAAPVPTPTPERPIPGAGPGGVALGGPRMAAVGVAVPPGAPVPRDISARSWVVADLDTGQVLGARYPHGRFPPASTQKWLTALTLLPEFPDRRRVVLATEADVNVDGTRVGLVPRGRYSIDLLFQAMLMVSGNDAANALARVAPGGVRRTVAAMNAEAARLQAYDTHAATPSGLDGPRQLTSAYDLALVARAALRRADFRRYTGQRRGVVPAQGATYRAFEFTNGNKLLYSYPGAFGGKTGFTDAAHHTFIGAAARGNRRLVVTMMFGEHRPDLMTAQAGRLLDWGFGQRGTAPVGQLVDPVDPAARPAASPTPSPSPSPTPAGTRATAAPVPAGAGGPPLPLVAGGLAAVVLAGWGGVALTRRRRA
jgi:D-alanyl-D-alanine carboxypeptidase (penicillin-binding protein 5/6)